MTEEEKKAHELCEEFMSLPEVQRYLKVKKEVEESPRLKDLKDKVAFMKKNVCNIPIEGRELYFKEMKDIQSAYDSDSLVVTYLQLKAEVEELEQPIRDLFII